MRATKHQSQKSDLEMMSSHSKFTDGIVPQALNSMLSIYNEYKNGFIRDNYDLKMSFLEIYNDKIIDLLQE